MVIKAIFFDLDNTLVDFFAMKRNSCEAAMNAMIKAGLKIEKKKGIKILFQLYDKYGIEYQLIFEKFLQKVLGKVDYKILAYGIRAYRFEKEHNLKPYSGTVKTLSKLKKLRIKMAIISDAPRRSVWDRLTAMKIDKYFDAVITLGDVRRQKTTSVPFNSALKALKVKPEEAIMVGDRPERDVKGAKKLGIKTVFAKYGNPKIKKSGADKEINRINALLTFVKTQE